MASTTLLIHPKPHALTSVMTDASDAAVGAVLQQYVDGHWQPISFFSKKLSQAETHYSTFDRELLAVYLAIKHFRYFLEGRVFHVVTDHKPLTHALSGRTDRYTPRQSRHLDFISQFTTDLRYIFVVQTILWLMPCPEWKPTLSHKTLHQLLILLPWLKHKGQTLTYKRF